MVFEFFIGGYFRSSYKLELSDTVLKCNEMPVGPFESYDNIIVIKGDSEWQELLNWLSKRKWEKEYWNEILDGTQWKLRVCGTNIDINSNGSNAYPPGFWKFMRLLNRVVAKAGIVIS